MIKERLIVWKKCKELWRCVCSTPNNPFACPCKYFIEYKKCKCNWEELVEWDTIEKWINFNINKK